MLPVTCTTEQKVPITASPTTASGQPSTFDGALRVTVQSGDGTVEQNPATPNAFNAVSGNAPGDTVYLVEADVDLGAGVELIQETVTLSVTHAKAANFGLVAGTAIAKDAAAALHLTGAAAESKQKPGS